MVEQEETFSQKLRDNSSKVSVLGFYSGESVMSVVQVIKDLLDKEREKKPETAIKIKAENPLQQSKNLGVTKQ